MARPIKYWAEDPLVLLQNLEVVVPTANMSQEETHNTVLRATIYIAVLVSLVTSNSKFLYVILVVAALSAMVYYFRKKEEFKLAQRMHGANIDFVEGEVCTKSTTENPFMNLLVTDYEQHPHRAPACPLDNPVVQPVVEDNFESRLFKDVGDVFGRMQSQRQFYTMPNTAIPNDQGAFAQWLYGSPEPSCKDGNGDQCLRNIHTPVVHL